MTTSRTPSSTASSSAVGFFGWTAPRSGPSTCPMGSYESTIKNKPEAAEFPERTPQNFRNAQRDDLLFVRSCGRVLLFEAGDRL